MSLPDRIGAVFCDVGGPIYDDANFVAAVLTALDEIATERRLGPVDRDEFDRIYRAHRARQSGSLRTALAAGLLGDAGLRGELHDRTRPHWVHPPGTLYPDAADLFRDLHGHVTTGVLANQEASVVDALSRDGLAPFIDIWGVSAVVGHEKPSPEFFAWALDAAGVTAEHSVHIGNRLDTDVRPAKALGMGTVWVTRGEAPEDPTAQQLAEADLSVPDLTGLASILLARTGAIR